MIFKNYLNTKIIKKKPDFRLIESCNNSADCENLFSLVNIKLSNPLPF